MQQTSRRSFLAAVAVVISASVAVDANGQASAPETYEVTIARDSFGVPHITAADWGSLSFGQGYAFAEDRPCTLLDQVVKVRGERSRWFGAGEDDANLNSDFAYRHLGIWEDAPQRWADQPELVQEAIAGYVAGFNAAVDQLGINGWCADEPWVAPITTQDLYAYVADVLLLASSRNFINEIGSAQPPSIDATSFFRQPMRASERQRTSGQQLRGQYVAWPGNAMNDAGASNAWAFGSEASASGGGMLLANPHFPWEGELRFWESHLMIPGEVNVYGAALSGLPGIQIGFNDAIAWSHTVSSGHRFTLYRYDLDPADPTVYLVDGEPEAMTPNEITIEVAAADGGDPTDVTRTLWSTHHGPVISLGPLPWSAEQAIAIRDGNIDITRVLTQFYGMDMATSMDEFQQVHATEQGVPWVNTIATSADGRAWYADTAATPNLSPEALAAWEAEVAAGGLLGLAYNDFGIVMLDGSDSLFEWVDDPAAPAPGLVPYADVPQIERADYVFNANDSYWLSNPDEPLTGFSPMHGVADMPQSTRTRTNIMLLEEREGPWTAEDIETTLFAERSAVTELLRQPLVDACTATPTVNLNGAQVDLTLACDTLAAWDGTYTLDARGAILFREWLARFDYSELIDTGGLFSDAFDAANPATTPSTPVEDRSEWLVELGSTVQLLELLGIPVDAPLGDWQFEVRTGDRLPIRGGTGFEGVANIVGCCADTTTMGPIPDTGEWVNEQSLLHDLPGYPVSDGSSFVMALEFTADGPVAEGFLNYGNPDDPEAPAYRLGLEAWSAGEWRPFLFQPEDVAALSASETTEITELSVPR
jgi:acyl-homoserine-lactone acylase